MKVLTFLFLSLFASLFDRSSKSESSSKSELMNKNEKVPKSSASSSLGSGSAVSL